MSPIRAPRPPPSSHRRPFSGAEGRGGGRVWAPEHRPTAWSSVPSPAPLSTCLQCVGHVKVDPGLLAFPVTQNEHCTGAEREQAATWGGKAWSILTSRHRPPPWLWLPCHPWRLPSRQQLLNPLTPQPTFSFSGGSKVPDVRSRKLRKKVNAGDSQSQSVFSCVI